MKKTQRLKMFDYINEIINIKKGWMERNNS